MRNLLRVGFGFLAALLLLTEAAAESGVFVEVPGERCGGRAGGGALAALRGGPRPGHRDRQLHERLAARWIVLETFEKHLEPILQR